jgi:hypothetical protein
VMVIGEIFEAFELRSPVRWLGWVGLVVGFLGLVTQLLATKSYDGGLDIRWLVMGERCRTTEVQRVGEKKSVGSHSWQWQSLER